MLRGHVLYLRVWTIHGRIVLSVGLNDASGIRAPYLKGPGTPSFHRPDRAALLAALASVDYVCIHSSESIQPLFANLLPDFLIKGGLRRPGRDLACHRIVQTRGGQVRALPH